MVCAHHGLDQQGPGVLQIADHDHGDHSGRESYPAVHFLVLPDWLILSSNFVQAYIVLVLGMGTPRRVPSSTTAPTTGSSSSGRPASRSCSIDVLWSPTFSAPAILCSIEIGRSIPNFAATASTSLLISLTTSHTPGSRAICASVARVSALNGLNATLPSSFTQISCRMRAVIGHRNPDLISASAMMRQRSDLVPSGSPSEMRFPSVWRMTPGSTISVPKYTIEPTTRAGSMDAPITPPGSTLSRGQNHHGTPICKLTTLVCCPRSGCRCGSS